MVNGFVKTSRVPAGEYHATYGRLAERLYRLVIAEEKRSTGISILRLLATSIAQPYALIMALRNGLFDLGLLPSHRPDCRVLSVGNLTLGGTGKTPMTLWLARFLADEGWRVAIVSRGYRGEGGARLQIVNDGRTILAESRLSGDEPQLMARHLPTVPVVCCPKRVLAVHTILERFQSEVVILDDGFQHRFLARDLDLVLLDSRRPLGNGHLFPRGPLRERASALNRAQALVLTRFDGSDEAEANRKELARQWPSKPIFTAACRPTRIFEAATRGERPPESLSGVRVAAFAGIGNPEGFFQSLRDLGARPVYYRDLPDHCPLNTELLNALVQEAAELNPELWLTTEKDWVRLPAVLPEHMELWVLAVELDFGDQVSSFKNMVRTSLKPTASVSRNAES